jgi:tetrahydrodipicolinate N-succinyltransferase
VFVLAAVLGTVLSLGLRMRTAAGQFVTWGATSMIVGVLLGAAAVFGVTLMVQQDTKPPLTAGDPQTSVLNRVEYGNRG